MKVAEVVRRYTSFWNDLMPFCDSFVAEINKTLCESYDRPLRSSDNKSRHAVVNEVGFDLFHTSVTNGQSVRTVVKDLHILNLIESTVRQRLARFVVEQPECCAPHELADAVQIAIRLGDFFEKRPELRTRVNLAGCGLLPTCEADVFADRTVYEVKAGDRAFLGSDLRQLLVYCALNSESRQYEINHVGLVNPRRGKFFIVDLEELCVRVSGASRYDVTTGIINLLSDAGPSQ